MIHSIPLRLRSIEVSARISVHPCGADCLLAVDEFDHAIPGGMALSMRTSAEGAIEGVLFVTRRGTYIKPKKTRAPSFGPSPNYSEASHRRALDALRSAGFEGISRPQRECDCSIEHQAVDGSIAWTPFSAHAPRLAELYRVHRLNTREQAAAFLKSAWSVLAGLNRLGIEHGDPAFYNFAVGKRVTLIDLDNCACTGAEESAWDQSVFIYSAVVPVLGGLMLVEEIAAFIAEIMGGAEILGSKGGSTLIPSIMHVVEHQRAARLARSLAIRNRALKVQIFETDTKLNACLREMHGHMDVVLRTAEERLDALEAAHAEMDMLRQELARRDTALKTLAGAARERLQALEAAHAEMDRLRRQIEQMRTS